MTEHFQYAFTLMIVGMGTVLLMLSMVVLLGNLIIALVNRFFPETSVAGPLGGAGVKQGKVAAIVAAVKIVTKGKGQVYKIEKK